MELTRRIKGFDVPKQFCPIVSDVPLLEETRRRVSLSVASDRTFFVLNRIHERFFSPLLADVCQRNLVIQPRNTGTAPAILYALLRLSELKPSSVLITASDHQVKNPDVLKTYIDVAFDAVAKRPESAVLLGMVPYGVEPGYGWIEPHPDSPTSDGQVCSVRRFWEKPSNEVAVQLMERGCLLNAFMIVGQIPTLLGLFSLATSQLYQSFQRIASNLGTPFEEQAIERLYAGLRPSDFSRDVLEPVAGSLRVLPVSDVGWSDLGEPQRVAKALARAKPRTVNSAA